MDIGMENVRRNAEALKIKAQQTQKAKTLLATADNMYEQQVERLEASVPDLTQWREEQRAAQKAAFEAGMAAVEAAFRAELLNRFPAELARIEAARRDLIRQGEEDIAEAEARYDQLLMEIKLSRAAEPLAAIRMSRARWRVLHDAGIKRAATLELWSSSDYSVKLYKKLRRALRLEEGAALPPEVEAALQPTQADLDEAMVWATTPDDTGYRQIDDTKVNAQVGVPYIPDPATLPAVDPAVLAKLDEMLGH